MTSSRATVILSPGLDQSKAVARLLRKRGGERRLVGAAMSGEARLSFRRPFDEIRAFSEDAPGDLSRLIPTGARSTAFLLGHGDIHLGSVTMTRDALRFYDKNWSIDAATQAGVPAPRTWSRAIDIEAFPVFYKSATEGGGRRGFALDVRDLPEDGSDLIFQEYIDSPGTYGVGIIAEEGKLRAAHVHHEIESYPEFGGSAVVVERLADARLRRYVEQLVKQTGYSGWGLVEFKYCPRRDDYVFMELNAKFWASSEFAFRNEPLFPKLLFGSEPVAKPCDRMIFMHRAFQRGARFVFGTLPGLIQGGELRFVPGAWQKPAIGMAVPRAAVARFKSLRSR